MTNIQRSGLVAIIGRPNVGKSTLLNHILGEKVSITSAKPQTTRWQILGIKTTDTTQTVYMDTPGIHKDAKRAMNRYLNKLASASFMDVNVILFVVDALQWREEDQLVLEKLTKAEQPIILVLNKIDLLTDKTQVLPLLEKMQAKANFAAIVPVSALKTDNITNLEKVISEFLPEGGLLYPEDQLTDKSVQFHYAEIIREKVIKATAAELPYSTTVTIEQLQNEEKILKISAVIWVEREGQKAIVIGKQGMMLKKIGSAARKDMEAYAEKKVFLQLWVKIKDNWSDDQKAMQVLGYK